MCRMTKLSNNGFIIWMNKITHKTPLQFTKNFIQKKTEKKNKGMETWLSLFWGDPHCCNSNYFVLREPWNPLLLLAVLYNRSPWYCRRSWCLNIYAKIMSKNWYGSSMIVLAFRDTWDLISFLSFRVTIILDKLLFDPQLKSF